MNAPVAACFFASVPDGCEATDLAPEEQVIVEKAKYVGPRRNLDRADRTLTVCSECADRGWDEILGYADGGI
jgi:hypothetical protein